ncbi:MAG: alpha/beta hydrolase, partial [Planctomycetes bacterium]|nr:alpha/beta hydrolase [Planctomycetota bacterium]
MGRDRRPHGQLPRADRAGAARQARRRIRRDHDRRGPGARARGVDRAHRVTPGGRDCPGADGAAGHLAPLQRAEFAPAPGQRLAGDHRPGAAPGYLFLHGLGSVRTGEKSESLFAHAAANGRACTRVDFRGHGESTGDFGEVTFSELIADALAVLGHLGPTVVVGSSLGALVGAFAAAARPDLVAGLALLAPALGFVSRLEQRVDADGRITTTDGRGFLLAPRVL